MINLTDAHTLTKRKTYPVKKNKSENREEEEIEKMAHYRKMTLHNQCSSSLI